MHDTSSTSDQGDTLDVRPIPPAQRHPTIFQRFEALPVGKSYVLVNDHDPKPLYYQLSFEYSGQLVRTRGHARQSLCRCPYR